MGTIRTSSRGDAQPRGWTLAFGLSALLLACGHGRFATTTALAEDDRRPSLGFEQEPARPEPRARAAVSPLVSLVADDVERVVRTYVLGVVREDLGVLESILADDARAGGGRTGGRQQIVDAWRARMRATDAARALVPPSARIHEMTVLDPGADDPKRAPGRPDGFASGDLLVRVPISRSPGDPRFGDVLVLVLRREHGELRIVTQADES